MTDHKNCDMNIEDLPLTPRWVPVPKPSKTTLEGFPET